MEAYKLWVRQNRQLVASLENVANTMTWFLPERFSSSEIGAESVAALLGLLTVLNQHIMDTAPPPQRFLHNTAATGQQRQCLALASSLSAVKQLEVLVEVAAEYYKGRDKKWNILAAMEAIKACLRFLILHRNGYRMLLCGGEAVHTEEALLGVANKRSSIQVMDRGLGGRQIRPDASTDSRRSPLPSTSLEAKATMALMKFGQSAGLASKPSWSSYGRGQDNLPGRNLPPVTQAPCVSKPIISRRWELPEELSVFGEWVFILRPLVYVLLIRRYGLKSWKPWLASLALDTTGLATILAAAFLKEKRRTDSLNECREITFSNEEVQEVKRRQVLLVLYLIRDPFFSMYTRRGLGAAERALRPIPLIGSIRERVVEFFTGIQSRYCYTSGS